jgi:DNA-binding winged helix-turn-helix (wHTH) protein
MVQTDAESRVVRFGVFDLDLKTGELRRKGVKVRLQEQPFLVLAMLVDRPGDLVTRDELRARLWPDAVFVDFDHGLNKAVGKIRQALGDLADSPRFVETLERRGYRFIAPVERVARSAAPSGAGRAAAFRLVWAGRVIPLSEGANLIGRDDASLVWIDSAAVSRCHAHVVVADGQAVLADLGSKNGTYLNDHKLDARRSLHDGDVIRVGPALLTFRSAPVSLRTITAAE